MARYRRLRQGALSCGVVMALMGWIGLDALMDNEFLTGISKQFKSMTGGDDASIPTRTPATATAPSQVTVADISPPSDEASVEDD